MGSPAGIDRARTARRALVLAAATVAVATSIASCGASGEQDAAPTEPSTAEATTRPSGTATTAAPSNSEGADEADHGDPAELLLVGGEDLGLFAVLEDGRVVNREWTARHGTAWFQAWQLTDEAHDAVREAAGTTPGTARLGSAVMVTLTPELRSLITAEASKASPVGPYVPSEVAIEVRGPAEVAPDATEWPLDLPIAELSAQHRDGQAAPVCLHGGDAADAFALLDDPATFESAAGTGTASIVQDGQGWSVDITPSMPGEQIEVGPCRAG